MSSDKPRVVVPSPRAVAVREIRLIDRIEEMQILREAADRAASGQGGIAFIYGEAGIGKTRLARELGAYASSRGMQVLSGRCPALFRMDGVPPYVLWEEIIKDYLEGCTPEQLFRVIGSYPIEISKLVPELKHKLRTFPQSFPLSPEHSRDRLFEAVTQFITNISKEAPLVVILDDLQWTDQSSLLLLHYLARGVYRDSLLVLGAYRDTYVDKKHPLTPVLTELNRERLLQSVSLKRLSFDDVSEMIKRILEQDDVSREFCRLVYEKTRGNPFFVEEVIRSLKEENVVIHKEKKWEIKEVSRIEFPETVKDVIKARISRLDDQCQDVLMMASFIGKDFTPEELTAITSMDQDKLLEIMDKLLKAGFIKRMEIRGEDVCSFTDIIVRDVVHEGVGHFKRKKLHGDVGKALEKIYADQIDKHFGELASHFLESGNKEKALDYFLKAGEKALKVYANNEAISNFQSALGLLEEKESELRERGIIQERLGQLKKVVGEYETCLKYWNEALQLWKQVNSKEKVARLHRRIANTLWDNLGNTEKASEHQNKALKVLEAEPESVELANLYADMSRLSWHTGHMDKALSLAEKALKLAKRLKAFEVVAKAYTNSSLVFSSTGENRKAVENLKRALKIALDNNYIELALRIYNNLSDALQSEMIEQSFEYTKKGFELAEKVGHIGWISWLGTVTAGYYIGLGDMDNALSLAENSLALDRKTGDLPNLCLSTAGLGEYHLILGDWEKSEQYFNEALNIAMKQKCFQAIARSYSYLGWLYAHKEELDKALDSYEKAMEVSEKAGAKRYMMLFSRGVIWVYIELGELKKAKALLNNLRKFALETKNRGLIGDADLLSGMMYRAQKKWLESAKHFKKASQELEDLKARHWNRYFYARFLSYEYGLMYLKRNRKGDKEKAKNLLNQALEIFQEMGAKAQIKKVMEAITATETEKKKVEPEPTAKVPLPSHVSTGYKELDEHLSGGLPQSYAVILTSPSYEERDLLIKRFLEAGANRGEDTFYITTKTTGIKNIAEGAQSNIYLFICNPEADAVIEDMPNVFKLRGVENLNDINIALTSAFRRLDKKPKRVRRICLEIISDVLLQHKTVQTRRWLNALIPKLKSEGFTTLAVIDPEIHPQPELRAIVSIFEGEININKRGTEKLLKIEKMTNQKYLESELSLEKEKLQSNAD